MTAMRKLAGALALAILIGGGSAQAATITLVADEWCPYNCEPGSDKPGYMIEIAQKIFAEAGHKVEYRNLPWSRAVAEARAGKFDGIVGAAEGDADDFTFPANALGESSNVLWVNKGDPWRYKDMSSFDTVSLGTIRDYSYGDDLDAYISKHEKDAKRVQIASGDNALDMNFKKLAAKRIGALVEDQNVAEYYLAGSGQAGKFASAGNLGEDPLFIAFSPASKDGKAYAKLLGDGIEKLRQSGELAKILAKYGLKDWK